MIFSKIKKHPLVWVLTFLCVIVGVVLLFHSCRSGETINRSTLPDVIINGDDDGYTGEDDGVAINATNGIILKSGTKKQHISLDNPKQNDCEMTITIYLSDGTEVFKSDYLQPGESVGDADINVVLKSGKYRNAMILYRCFKADKNHTPITQTEIPVEIGCI